MPGASPETREPAWELFDLETDPFELHSVYADPEYAGVADRLTRELRQLQHEIGDVAPE